MRTWSGAGVSVLVCTGEQRLRWIGGGLGCFSCYYNITHIYLRAACNDMVYPEELERDVTTRAMAKGILRLKTLVFIPS